MKVSKSEVIRACESHVNMVQGQNWQYFNGVYCTKFFYEDASPSVNDFSGYDEFLKINNLDDEDNNYSNYIQSVKDYWACGMKKEIEVNGEYVAIEYVD